MALALRLGLDVGDLARKLGLDPDRAVLKRVYDGWKLDDGIKPHAWFGRHPIGPGKIGRRAWVLALSEDQWKDVEAVAAAALAAVERAPPTEEPPCSKCGQASDPLWSTTKPFCLRCSPIPF